MNLPDDTPSLRDWLRRLDERIFAPADTRVCAWLRIGFGLLVTINLCLLAMDMEQWFGELGAVPYAAGRAAIDPDTVTLFSLLPKTCPALLVC